MNTTATKTSERLRPAALGTTASLLAALFCLLVTTMTQAQSTRELQRATDEALAELRVEDAAAALERLLASGTPDASSRHLEALVRHHQGRYEEALAAINLSLELEPAEGEDHRPELQQLIRSTRDATQNFVESVSDDGRFVVRHAPGRDATLVPYAMDALQRADDALADELGVRVPGPIRLEIYGSAELLAAVSSLTVENIQTSGTIALCKWDRLMVTSPRALLRGYPWMDTIAHEFVHLVLARMSQDRAPVWVQEGVAKFLEQRWRKDQAENQLSPAVQGILNRAVAAGELLPFERLHPSIALLPSQEQAALAFAQVSSFVALYYRTFGKETLQQAIGRMANGADAREAFGGAANRTFANLESTWRRSLQSGDGSEAPEFMGLEFGHDEASEADPQAARHLRLGDMLWGRERFGAAAHEYERALEAKPNDPLLAARLARAALASSARGGDGSGAALAIRTLEPLASAHPDYAPVRAYLGSAYRAVGRNEDAQQEALAAISLNPFDPRPHCDLAAVGGDTVRAREERQCASLGGEQP